MFVQIVAAEGHRLIYWKSVLEIFVGEEKDVNASNHRAYSSPSISRQIDKVEESVMKIALGSFLSIVCILVLGITSLEAQQQSDIEMVRAANKAFYKFISGENVAQFDKLWAHEPYVRAIHPVSPQVEKGWETVRAGFMAIFERYDNIHSAMPEPQIRVGDNVAWVTGEEEFRAVRASSGEEISVTLLGTNVFEKMDGQWLLVHHHVSVAAKPQN